VKTLKQKLEKSKKKTKNKKKVSNDSSFNHGLFIFALEIKKGKNKLKV
jgi:hypothetical protein